MSRPICPIDGVRLVLVTGTNPQGDDRARWECPTGDWAGPWYTGDEEGGRPIPEVTREAQFSRISGSVSVSEPVSVDDNAGSLTVDAVDLDIRNLSSAQDTVSVPGVALDTNLTPIKNRFSPSTGSFASNPVSVSGNTTVYTPAAGQRIRLKWIFLGTLDSNSANVVVGIKFGSSGTAFYTVPMGKPGAFAHGTVREGAANDPLVLNLSAAQPVYVSFDLEEF